MRQALTVFAAMGLGFFIFLVGAAGVSQMCWSAVAADRAPLLCTAIVKLEARAK